MNDTIEYYNKNAQSYYEITAHIDMSLLCDRFLSHVTPGGKIIDIGSGSGRDIQYFIDKGYKAEGIDASAELCKISQEHGLIVKNITIQDWIPERCYDGIWANASLVHIRLKEFEEFLIKAKGCLNKDGVIFISMKIGMENDRDEKGRYVCVFDEFSLLSILSRHPDLRVLDQWYSKDLMSRDTFEWLNVIFALV